MVVEELRSEMGDGCSRTPSLKAALHTVSLHRYTLATNHLKGS